MKAFILATAVPGKAMELVRSLRGLAAVKGAHAVTGPYDVIAQVEIANLEELGQLIISRIQTGGLVEHTVTCVVAGD